MVSPLKAWREKRARRLAAADLTARVREVLAKHGVVPRDGESIAAAIGRVFNFPEAGVVQFFALLDTGMSMDEAAVAVGRKYSSVQ